MNRNQRLPARWWAPVIELTEVALIETAALTVAASVPIVLHAVTDRPAVWGLPSLLVLWTAGPLVVAALALLREWLRSFDPDLPPPGRLRRAWRVLRQRPSVGVVVYHRVSS